MSKESFKVFTMMPWVISEGKIVQYLLSVYMSNSRQVFRISFVSENMRSWDLFQSCIYFLITIVTD